jgi:hypothetical protein
LTHAKLRDVAMPETANRKDFNLDYLLHPAGTFPTPMAVVDHPHMTVQEKRAVLASWASDACAVEAAHDLRRPPSAPTVRFDEVMDALKQLDGEASQTPHYRKIFTRAQRLKVLHKSNQAAYHLPN